jgi:hypothetical protein
VIPTVQAEAHQVIAAQYDLDTLAGYAKIAQVILQRRDLAAVIPMTLPAICSNFLFLLARLASASAAVCAPPNHRSGDD